MSWNNAKALAHRPEVHFDVPFKWAPALNLGCIEGPAFWLPTWKNLQHSTQGSGGSAAELQENWRMRKACFPFECLQCALLPRQGHVRLCSANPTLHKAEKWQGSTQAPAAKRCPAPLLCAQAVSQAYSKHTWARSYTHTRTHTRTHTWKPIPSGGP